MLPALSLTRNPEKNGAACKGGCKLRFEAGEVRVTSRKGKACTHEHLGCVQPSLTIATLEEHEVACRIPGYFALSLSDSEQAAVDRAFSVTLAERKAYEEKLLGKKKGPTQSPPTYSSSEELLTYIEERQAVDAPNSSSAAPSKKRKKSTAKKAKPSMNSTFDLELDDVGAADKENKAAPKKPPPPWDAASAQYYDAITIEVELMSPGGGA